MVVDERLLEQVMRLYGLRTKREAIDFALRRAAGAVSTDPHAGMLALEGAGWDGDLDAMRESRLPKWLDS